MTVLGWTAFALGGILFLWSLAATLRANRGVLVPYNRAPAVVPRGTVAARSIGAVMFVVAAVALGSAQGPWVVLVPVAVLAAGLLAMIDHNRRASAADAD
ncbi:hypothetical protein Q9S71_11890 [Microbacterium sp. KSW4-11]|uniref:DUF3784 domain-containing protein n=1 Tax=Microbacterium gawkjiense TaxID=3067309 RepID=A0ABU3GCI6_9MICO|nr:hypothetical protein [Microbacterium sp. KSW4-11]MDT3317518.1 hypothetical protein [Microbacterium sp. KSW4-11]